MSDPPADRWRQTCQLFAELTELDDVSRQQRLAAVGSGDPELRKAVEALLAADRYADERLARLDVGITRAVQDRVATVQSDALGLVGRTVSHFRIIESIGSGGMGVVYRAEDLRLRRQVALKLPLVTTLLDRSACARFLREARAAAALDHPNLCSVHEVGESEDGYPFIAMPLYEGETLRDRIDRAGVLPVGEAIDIARQVALGLERAHAAGVVHRDLKPGNIMLLPDGTAKVLDFGLAKLADLTQTAAGTGPGTARYMAPEQIRGAPVDARADLWSVGVVLHEALTGRRPFDGDDLVAATHAILHAAPAAPSRSRPSIPRALDHLVLSLLEKDPSHRYPDAQRLAADLDAIGRGLKPSYRPRLLKRAALWRRTRSRRFTIAVVLLTAGTMLMGYAATRRAGPFSPRPHTANAEAHRLYLRGRAYAASGQRAAADSVYSRALALDPDFALARTWRAAVYLADQNRPPQARLALTHEEVTAALRARPGLADAHFVLGMYWQVQGEHARALAEFASAREGMRDVATLHAAIGVSARALGRWQEALTALERALALDSINFSWAPDLALTYGRLRRYEDSQRMWARYLMLTPEDYGAMIIKGHAAIRMNGTADTLAAWLARIPPDVDQGGMVTFSHVQVARIRRRWQDVFAALERSRHGVSQDVHMFVPHGLIRGEALRALGDSARARAAFESARALVVDSLKVRPEDPRLHIALARAWAGLGRSDEAVSAARRAEQLAPLPRDFLQGTAIMGEAAAVFAAAGETHQALDRIEQLLRMPAGREMSVALLTVDPNWDPLRGEPRFQRLLRAHSAAAR